MIDPKAEPIGNRTPYKPVDLRPKWRKPERPLTITREMIEDNLASVPDPAYYWRDPYGNWHLYEDQ